MRIIIMKQLFFWFLQVMQNWIRRHVVLPKSKEYVNQIILDVEPIIYLHVLNYNSLKLLGMNFLLTDMKLVSSLVIKNSLFEFER